MTASKAVISLVVAMPMTVTKLLLIAAGGAAGTLLRYGLGGLVQGRMADSTFPWGTLTVNLLGCLLIGSLWVMGEEKSLLGPEMRLMLMVGLLGAFTTFSTFGLETMNLVAKGQWLAAGGNVLASVLLGLLGVWLGMTVTRAVWP
ncbi:MAG: fluoride efflux transporter CrcB [Planctomycetes bacterium]|nr:fluoride efflux transporter CrcB [Planctomycetota bacterium]